MQLVPYRTLGAAAFPSIVTATDFPGLPVGLSSPIARSLPADRGGAAGRGERWGEANKPGVQSLR